MPKIILRYDQAGGVEVDGQGFKGKACEKATAKFLHGRTTTKDTKKPEYSMPETSGITQTS